MFTQILTQLKRNRIRYKSYPDKSIDNELLKESARPLKDAKSSISIFNQQAFENQLTKWKK